MLEMQRSSQETDKWGDGEDRNGRDPRALPRKEIVKYNKSLRDRVGE